MVYRKYTYYFVFISKIHTFKVKYVYILLKIKAN